MQVIKYVGHRPRGQKNMLGPDGLYHSFYFDQAVELESDEWAKELLALRYGLHGQIVEPTSLNYNLQGKAPFVLVEEKPEEPEPEEEGWGTALSEHIPAEDTATAVKEKVVAGHSCKHCGESFENRGFLMAHYRKRAKEGNC